MKQKFVFRGLTISGVWVCGNLNILHKKFHNIEAGTYISNDSGEPFAFRVLPETVVLEKEGD